MYKLVIFSEEIEGHSGAGVFTTVDSLLDDGLKKLVESNGYAAFKSKIKIKENGREIERYFYKNPSLDPIVADVYSFEKESEMLRFLGDTLLYTRTG